MPGAHDSPKRAIVAESRRKPAPSVGMLAPAARVRSGDLFSAYLARFVDPETSLQGAGSGPGGLAGVGAHPASGVQAGHFQPTRHAAGACLPPLVGLRMI